MGTDQPLYATTDWLQQKTYHIIQHHFHHATTLHSLHHLLRLLDSQSIVLVFKFDGNTLLAKKTQQTNLKI